MMESIKTLVNQGISAQHVEVECRITSGLPSMVIIGSPSSVVFEAKERIRSAILSSGLDFPRQRITINLAPAEIPKSSAELDLAMAIAILQANLASLKREYLKHTVFLGELGLDGSIRPVRGIIGKLLKGRRTGICFIIPAENYTQASQLSGVRLVPARSLLEVCNYLTTGVVPNVDIQLPSSGQKASKLVLTDEIIGQEQAKRAALIAASGGHNIIFHGPPGTGKSMLGRYIPLLMPRLSTDESYVITNIHSLVAENYVQLITERPFRAPHHTISFSALIGGGSPIKPGEVTLSHGGVLFLDELPEFNRQALESLRQPMESKSIVIIRSKESTELPADFLLVATANPCPCGYFGSDIPCTCSASQLARYQQKLSGPIMDRIDLSVPVVKTNHTELLNTDRSVTDISELQTIVRKAWKRQQSRYKSGLRNATINDKQLKKCLRLDNDGKKLLDQAAIKLQLSARGYMKTVRVSQTIADIEDVDTITVAHVAEALHYRQRINQL